jgi:type I restriction enzyme, R subunit
LLSEKHTRKNIIDNRLLEAGWDVSNKTQVVEEFNFSVGLPEGVEEPLHEYQGQRFCDYVLLGKDGKPLAVVEAKKSSEHPDKGREQAKQYCYNLKEKTGELPFCFYTNGHDIYFWDLENYPPKKVHGFPTLDDLQRYKNLRRSRKPLAGEFINIKIAGRDYQQRAIRSVLEAIEKRHKRFLLVMATGTGKTRTCIALVAALMSWLGRKSIVLGGSYRFERSDPRCIQGTFAKRTSVA